MTDESNDDSPTFRSVTEVEDLIESSRAGQDSQSSSSSSTPRRYQKLAADQSSVQTDDNEALTAVRMEARESLNKTIDGIHEKDDKAMRTVRINLILIGFAVTAVTSFPAVFQLANKVTIGGFGLLIISTSAGILTYTGTDYPTGVGATYLQDIQDAAWTNEEWSNFMILEYEKWLQDSEAQDSGEYKWLFITHFFQVLGLVTILIGTFVAPQYYDPASFLPITMGNESVNSTELVFYSPSIYSTI